MKQDVTDKTTVEDLKTIRSVQMEELIHGFWLVLHSEDAFARETRNRLVESFKKLKFLSKKKNLKILIKSEETKLRKKGKSK